MNKNEALWHLYLAAASSPQNVYPKHALDDAHKHLAYFEEHVCKVEEIGASTMLQGEAAEQKHMDFMKESDPPPAKPKRTRKKRSAKRKGEG